jgi:hypothetical protein
MLGLLKRLQIHTNFVPKITTRTAYETVTMFQKGMGDGFLCYSFYEY